MIPVGNHPHIIRNQQIYILEDIKGTGRPNRSNFGLNLDVGSCMTSKGDRGLEIKFSIRRPYLQ